MVHLAPLAADTVHGSMVAIGTNDAAMAPMAKILMVPLAESQT